MSTESQKSAIFHDTSPIQDKNLKNITDEEIKPGNLFPQKTFHRAQGVQFFKESFSNQAFRLTRKDQIVDRSTKS